MVSVFRPRSFVTFRSDYEQVVLMGILPSETIKAGTLALVLEKEPESDRIQVRLHDTPETELWVTDPRNYLNIEVEPYMLYTEKQVDFILDSASESLGIAASIPYIPYLLIGHDETPGIPGFALLEIIKEWEEEQENEND